MNAFSTTLFVAFTAFAATASASIIPVEWSTISYEFIGDHPGLNFVPVTDQVQDTSPAGALDIGLGTFTLDPLTNDFFGNFTLTVVFSRPDLINGGNSSQISATYTGVDRKNNDTASILFDPFQQTFNFDGKDGMGSFNFSIDGQVDLSNKEHGTDIVSSVLYGHITDATLTPDPVAPVPEPSSMALLGSVMSALALGTRRGSWRRN